MMLQINNISAIYLPSISFLDLVVSEIQQDKILEVKITVKRSNQSQGHDSIQSQPPTNIPIKYQYSIEIEPRQDIGGQDRHIAHNSD